ncbi:MAG: putative hydro-lyase [Fimbriimonadaceae bacterium]|nr:putative hydro-lyase [Alphaproteobacteria bacterium]
MDSVDLQQTEKHNAALFENLRSQPLETVRKEIRSGNYSGQTAGLGLGYLQGNLAILPVSHALDFFRFCQRNPKPCPLVGVSDTGDPKLFTLGRDIDIRTDIPKYNIYRDGELAEQRIDIADLWSDDFVTFVLGCSFSFEEALMAEGIRLKHIEENRIVSMYRTNIKTVPAGPFGGELVVSMRPLRPVDAIRACAITARFPHTHGMPVHIGDPSQIGIENIDSPDWGDHTDFDDNETPVFWACGVTPQAAIRSAKPPICITHTPGHMLITDLMSSDLGS